MITRSRRPALAAGILATALALAGCSSATEAGSDSASASPSSSEPHTTGLEHATEPTADPGLADGAVRPPESPSYHTEPPATEQGSGQTAAPSSTPTWEHYDEFRDLWGQHLHQGDGHEAAWNRLGEMGYAPDSAGLVDLPGAVDWAQAPNGQFWPVHAYYDVDTLVAGASPAQPEDRPRVSVDCVDRWKAVTFMGLRGGEDPGAYGGGYQQGPTCWVGQSGAPAQASVREVHYICQAGGTTARALVSHADGGPADWTPENTTGTSRECFGFSDTVLLYEVDVSRN